MKISVIGLGYVGTATSIGFAHIGYDVIGVDKVEDKVNKLNQGKSYIKNNILQSLLKQSIAEKRFVATSDLEYAVLNSDISFVCVETPSNKDGEINLNAVKSVLIDVGKTIKNKKKHTVVIKSTIFPTYLEYLKDILEQNSQKKCYDDFGFAINPEFLREKTSIEDFLNPSLIVVGSGEKKYGDQIMNLYKKIKGKRFNVDEKTALMIKYTNNSFHALKVSFANETGNLCEKIGMNGKGLMELVCADYVLNISPYYLKPGEAYRGSCLPKDLAVLQNNIKKLHVKCPLIDAISKSNEIQKKRDKKQNGKTDKTSKERKK